MRIVTARQAILNRKKQVVAYELLYRDGETNSFPDIDPHQATGKLLLNTHLNQGIPKLTEGKKAFINFTASCIKKRFPLMLPKEQIIVELVETIDPTDDEIFNAVRELFHAGYKIALDDFLYRKEWVRYFPFVRLIKFDISVTPLEKIVPLLKKLKELNHKFSRKNRIHLLAERIETKEEYEAAMKLGFNYFQGYYFFKPEIKEGRDVELSALTLFQLYKELCRPELNINNIAEYFKNDAGLLYKLLTYINSGVLPTKNPITDVKQALVYLGAGEVRKLLALLTATEMAVGKPKYLAKEGAVRARCCESVAIKVVKEKAGEAFLAGLVSMLPSLLDCDIEKLVDVLPLSEEIQVALLGPKPGQKDTILRNILKAVLLHGEAKWHDTVKECQKVGISYDVLSHMYTDAVAWASDHHNKMASEDKAA